MIRARNGSHPRQPTNDRPGIARYHGGTSGSADWALSVRSITIPLRPAPALVGPRGSTGILRSGITACPHVNFRVNCMRTLVIGSDAAGHPHHRRRCSDHPDRDSRSRHGEPARAFPPQAAHRAQRRPHHHGPAVRQHRARVRRQRQRDHRRRLQARAHHRGVPAGVVRLQRGVRPDEHLEEPHARPRGVAVRRRAVDERRRRVRPAHPRPGAARSSRATSRSSPSTPRRSPTKR